MGRAESMVGSGQNVVQWSRRRAAITAVALMGLLGFCLGAAPAGAQLADTGGGSVTLVVGRPAGVTTGDVTGALAGVDATAVSSVPHLNATTVTVPRDQVAEASSQLDSVSSYVQLSVTYHAAQLAPVDPYYSSQAELTQVDAQDAWKQTTGAGMVVAVVDSGIISGPDFVDGSGSSIVAGYDEIGQDTDPTDVPSTDPSWSSHGTLVASVLAARPNSFGIVGMCPGCRIMPVRVLGSDGSGTDVDIAQGIQFAATHGANVINLSLGGPESDLVDGAIDQARADGIVVVAAAGNDGDGLGLSQATAPEYPAAHPGVLSVASTCSSTAFATGSASCAGESPGEVASFSGRGSWVDVAAPGVAYATQGSNLYVFTGTSASTPFVAGAAALVRAAHPTWTEAQVRAELAASAAPVTPAGMVSAGEIRAGAAVAAVTPPAVSVTTPPSPPGRTPPTGTIDPPTGYLHDVETAVVHASDDVAVASVELWADGRPLVSLVPAGPGTWASWWNTAQVPDGPVTLTAQITDEAGNQTMTAPVGGAIDNTAPSIVLFGPRAGTVEKKSFGVAAFTSDAGSGVRLTLVASGNQIVGGSGAPVGALALVPVTRRGTIVVRAAAVDAVGHVSFSNAIVVVARPARR